MKLERLGDGVFYARDELVTLSDADLERLKGEADASPRRRARVCTHREDDTVHEMFIVLRDDGYVAPHKHVAGPESLHFIEGAGDLVLFDDRGRRTEVLRLAGDGGGDGRYYRMRGPVYHTLLPRTRYLVFHETAAGPFVPGNTVRADWAPDEGDLAGGRAWLEGQCSAARDDGDDG